MFRQRILMWGLVLLVAFLLGSATSSEALPDLVVSKLLGPATVKLGDAFYLAVTVKNQGTDPSGPTRVVFYFSTDSTINTSDYLISYYCPIQGLGPGEESPPPVRARIINLLAFRVQSCRLGLTILGQ
jgi:hypothetical protein